MIDISGLSYYEINLDSRDATSTADAAYSSLDYPLFELGGKLPLQRIAYMKILSASIPFSYYVINTENNTFTLTDTSGVFLITLKPGTYSSTSMATELTTKLTASASTFTYTATFDSDDQSFSIVNGSVLSLLFTFTFSGLRTSIAPNLGFSTGVNTSQTHTASTGNQLKGSATQLLGASFLYVNSNTVGNDVGMFLPKGSLAFANGGPQMTVVPTQGVYGDDIHYVDPCPQQWFDMQGMDSLTKMDMFITDGDTLAITKFNGKSFSVKIGLMLQNESQTYGHIDAGKVKVTGKRVRRE